MIAMLDQFGRMPRAILLALVGAALAVLLLMGYRAWALYEQPRDFSYFWMTGRIWMNGDNAYSPDYGQLAAGVWRDNGFHRWLYSPHIWPITRLLAAVDYDAARTIWVAINTSLLAISTAMIAAVLPLETRGRAVFFAALLIYTSVALGAAVMLSTGQFAAFVYLGIAAFAYAVIRGARWAMGVALFILTMKVSLGLAFLAFALMDRRWWGSIAAAAVVALLASIPVLMTAPLGEIVSGYLHGVKEYGTFKVNQPPAMTGLRTLLDRWMGVEISGVVLALTATVTGAVAGFMAARSGQGQRAMIVVAFLACVMFLVPMHLYDLVIVSVLAVGITRPLFAVGFGLACLALFRVNRLSDLIGIEEQTRAFAGSYLASLILGLLLVVALISLSRSKKNTPA